MISLAITGVGIASTAGSTKDAFFAALEKGAVCKPFSPEKIQSFDAKQYDPQNVVEVLDFDPTQTLGDKGLRTLDRTTKLLLVATRACLADAGIKKDNAFASLTPRDVGFVCSNAYGSLEAITELDRVALLEDARYINPAKFPNTVSNSAAGYVSIWEDLRALNVSVANGNTGVFDAIGIADIHLASERARVLIVGGCEAMCEALFLAFRKLGAFSDHCLGEGAALFAIESDASAKARGATVLGRIVGTGTHFSAPKTDEGLFHASDDALTIACDRALLEAGLAGKDIDLVVSGTSGIRPFDTAEAKAIARACGDDVAVFAPKMIFGETLGASGGIALGAALHAIAGGVTHPLTSGRAKDRVTNVLLTSLGYYGTASAIVVTR